MTITLKSGKSYSTNRITTHFYRVLSFKDVSTNKLKIVRLDNISNISV